MIDLLKEQLAFVPEVVGSKTEAATIVCGGMGGSALPALMLRFLGVSRQVLVHRDYDLPAIMPEGAACVAISYSGETEETLSFARAAREKGIPLSIVTSGGALLAFAKEQNLPYVQVPAGYQPRDAVVATTKALLALTGEDDLLEQLSRNTFSIDNFEGQTEKQVELLSATLKGATPIFYASTRNEQLAYMAKIQCNETAKMPAFSNVFPELNHNELQGFDVVADTESLSKPFVTVFLYDDSDDQRIQHRMQLTKELLQKKGIRTTQISLRGDTRAQMFMYTWWLLRTLARALAKDYAVDPDSTPLITAFKASL